jgi:hypothetical protein
VASLRNPVGRRGWSKLLGRGSGSHDPKQVLRMSSLIQPELVWLAVAFTVLMAGMLAGATE